MIERVYADNFVRKGFFYAVDRWALDTIMHAHASYPCVMRPIFAYIAITW